VMARGSGVNAINDSAETNSVEAGNQRDRTEQLPKHEWL